MLYYIAAATSHSDQIKSHGEKLIDISFKIVGNFIHCYLMF